MITRSIFGNPIETDAVLTKPSAISFQNEEIEKREDGFYYTMKEDDIVYGLGENNRGINKRGWMYISSCNDDPVHTEDKRSLYGAHNFILISGEKNIGIFVDTPGKVTFDIGYTKYDELHIKPATEDFEIYVIENETPDFVITEFRGLIGMSYIPPKWAFGYGQSRWSYFTSDEVREVVKKYRENHIPIDSVYLDIDYMERYKDFTINQETFADFDKLVEEMKEQHIHLVPIIDAGVKKEDGYDVYEEGKANNYFCKDADGNDFIVGVWPGKCCFPDMLNDEAREWFGNKYKVLLDKGIDGFWNDMCEPAIFYTPEGVEEYKEYLQKELLTCEVFPPFDAKTKAAELANNPKDYRRFYHNVDGTMVRHDKVHNLYGMNMTRAAFEGLQKTEPEKRFLLFSRSSFIGAHRYGGVWTGDNASWWSHLLLNLKMMPSLNMCGFLFTGADLGGFGSDTTRELLLRWLALGVFTPLMRNHAAIGTREQECYQFEHVEDFCHVIGVRYRLLPYIYSEFMKAALSDDMYCKPLAFDFPEDSMAKQVEDQLLIGNEIMIAPVYTQNAAGRYVYLPEEMKFIKFQPDGSISEEILEKGHHYIEVALNEVPLFIRKDKCIPIVDAAECVDDIDLSTKKMIGYEHAEYNLYDDDGISMIR